MASGAVSTQEQKEWTTNLCDCCQDTNTLSVLCFAGCYGFWCCPCLACTVSGQVSENYCLPLCDIFSPAIMAACGLPLFVPPAAYGLRASIRNKYGIKGSLCKDIGVSCFCACCSWCQMHRELKNRNKAPVIINVQNPPPAPVNTQPTVMMMMTNQPGFANQPGFVNQPGFMQSH